jgi:hypothetical protein
MGLLEDAQNPYLTLAEQASDPATPAAGLWELYSKSGGLYLIDDAGAVVGPFGTGGGGGSGALLAYVAHNPGTLASYTTTSTSAADVDATNLEVTFTAPSSGAVLVRLSGLGGLTTTTGSQVNWLLRESTTTVANTQVSGVNSADNFFQSVAFVVTGLTPGASYTYKWGWMVSGSSTTARLFAGTGAGQAVMEVHALP